MDRFRFPRRRRTEAPRIDGDAAVRSNQQDPYQAYLRWVEAGRPALSTSPLEFGAIPVGMAPRRMADHVQVSSALTGLRRWIAGGR